MKFPTNRILLSLLNYSIKTIIMKIQYYTKHVYGVPRMYIANRWAFDAEIVTGEKTLSLPKKHALESLGLIFEEVLSPKAK